MDSKFNLLYKHSVTVFQEADKDGNGWLSKNEMKNYLHKHDDIRYELRQSGGRTWGDFWDELDADDDGKITKDELVDYMKKIFKENVSAHSQTVFKAASSVFRKNDKKFSGSIVRSTLQKALQNEVDVQDAIRLHNKHWGTFWDNLEGEEEITLDELKEYIFTSQEAYTMEIFEDAASGKLEEEEQQQEEEEVKATEAAKEEEVKAATEEKSAEVETVKDANTLDKKLWVGGEATIEERIDALKSCANKVFDIADRDNDGVLSKRELKRVLQQQYDIRFAMKMVGGRTWASFWDELDENDDGKIQREEMISYFAGLGLEAANLSIEPVQNRAKEIFERADKDKNGWLSRTELKRVLHDDDDIRDYLRQAHGRTWKSFFDELDADNDNKITFKELDSYIRTHHLGQMGN